MRKLLMLLLLGTASTLGVSGLAGCRDDGPVEEGAEEVEEAAEEMGDEVEEATD